MAQTGGEHSTRKDLIRAAAELAELCPIAPPARPYQAALGLVPDLEIATAWGLGPGCGGG